MGSSRIRLTIAYDSEAAEGFETGWGFSVIVSKNGLNILFDCGWDGHMLRRNLGRMGYTLSSVSTVFLSHPHWDHISGLSEVLQDAPIRERLEVVLHEGFSHRMREEIGRRARLTLVNGIQEIVPGMWSSGALGSDIREQALVIPVKSGSMVITGCAHPGLSPILEIASELRPVTILIGGFHDAKPSDFPETLERLVLCHCTRAKTELLRSFPSVASLGRVGASYEFEI
ncbi:MAG: MBL fold metallo-hydrolase [Thermoplasmata archaeon]